MIQWSRGLDLHVSDLLRAKSDKDFLAALVKATEKAIRDIEVSLDRKVACLSKIRKVHIDRTNTRTICINIVTGELRACPEFIQTWVKTAADFGFLLLHERGHLILNYIANTTVATPFEEDAIINVNAIPMSGSDLLTRFYSTRALQGHPVMLILQSDHSLVRDVLFASPAFRHGPWQRVLEWHQAMYSRGWTYLSPSESMVLLKAWRDACMQANGQSGQGKQGQGQGRRGRRGKGRTGNGQPGQGSPGGQQQGQQGSGEGTPGDAQQFAGSSGSSDGQRKAQSEARRQQAKPGTTGSGTGEDAQDKDAPLGHEAGNKAQAAAHEKGDNAAKTYKSQHPQAFTPEGAPSGDGKDVSFASMHVPEEAGLCPQDKFGGFTYLEMTRPSVHGKGVTMTTLLTTRLGGSTVNTTMNPMVPSRVMGEDLTYLAMGHVPPVWEHETAPQETEADLYLDFSGSMRSYWGLTLAVAKELRFKVKHIEGFATSIGEADINSGGISVGGGTNLMPVLKKMDERRTECAVWVTDLGFTPGTYSDEGVAYLNFLLGRTVKRLIVLVPAYGDIASFDSAAYMERYFGKLNAAARACITLHPINSRGETH